MLSRLLVTLWLACLAHLITAAPADEGYGDKNQQIVNCVKRSLKGKNIDYRVVTQKSNTFASASKGDILYVHLTKCSNID